MHRDDTIPILKIAFQSLLSRILNFASNSIDEAYFLLLSGHFTFPLAIDICVAVSHLELFLNVDIVQSTELCEK